MRVLRSRLQCPRSKQHYVRPLLRRSSRRSQMRPWSTKQRIWGRDSCRGGGRPQSWKSHVETVINKDEMIDVIGCTKRGHGCKGVATRWSATGCRGRHTVVSGRMRVLERGIQPAFSGKCPVQVNQVSITETMLDEARGKCNRLELRRWRLKEEKRLSEGTALEREGETWSLAERTWVTTWSACPRLPRRSTWRTWRERNDQEACQKTEGVPNAGSRGSRRNPKEWSQSSRKRHSPSPPKPSKTHCMVSYRPSSRRWPARQLRSMSKASDTINHAMAKVQEGKAFIRQRSIFAGKAAQRREDTVGLLCPEGKLCVAGHHEEGTMKCMAWSRSLEWNTDPIETAELEDLIGQTLQCMYSCEEHHAHELAEAHRWTVDETHDLTIGCQARGGCKGCVGVPRGSTAERISDWQPGWAIVVASGGVLGYTHIPTPLDDSTRPLDNSNQLHTPQSTKSWRSGNLHHPGWGHTGGSRSIPTVHPCSQSGRRLCVARKALHLQEPNHEGNGRSIHNAIREELCDGCHNWSEGCDESVHIQNWWMWKVCNH